MKYFKNKMNNFIKIFYKINNKNLQLQISFLMKLL